MIWVDPTGQQVSLQDSSKKGRASEIFPIASMGNMPHPDELCIASTLQTSAKLFKSTKAVSILLPNCQQQQAWH